MIYAQDSYAEPRRIKAWEVDSIRNEMPRVRAACCGEVAEVKSTGRATCRGCGRKIRKDQRSLEALYDFQGNGLGGDPFTGVWIKVHLDPTDCA